MDNELEVIHDQMEETRASLAEKIEKLEEQVLQPVEAVSEAVTTTAETVEETIQSVREALDLRHHIRERPWLAMAGAVATGFLGDRLLLGRSSPALATTNGSASANGHGTNGSTAHAAEEGGRPLERMLCKLRQQAVGTLMGSIRDFVLQVVPESISADAVAFVDDLTIRFGGKPLTKDDQKESNQEVAKQQPVAV